MDAQATDSWIGRTLGGRYRILELIGEGGMGVVYKARQLSVDREVAVKMMHTRAAQDPQWSERFQSEAKACSLLTHPNTIRLYDFGKTTLGNFYMVMELLTGRSLTQVIQEEAPMEAGRVLRILMQCCASLAESHNAGIIHRDIKPDNIFVQKLEGANDFIKLFDFSIAKRSDVQMTATGIIMGTPQFMSPEQGRGETIDSRSDLYSLGIVAYAMLSGRLPFHDEDALEVLRMHQNQPVPPLPEGIPNSVAMLVMSCLDKNPARRPATAMALLEASKIWLTELDPTLDVSSDPILKNTLISGGSPTQVQPPGSMEMTREAYAKTMLGASGVVKLGAPIAKVTTPAPTQEQPSAPKIDSRQTLVKEDTGAAAATKSLVSDSSRTLIHGESPAAPDQVTDASQTLLRGGDQVSDSKRTAIQSPSGPQRSESEETRREMALRPKRSTNQPTINEFSRQGRGSATAAETRSEQPQAAPMAPSPQPATTSPAAAPAAPAPPQPAYGADSDSMPAMVQPGLGSFLVACLLVALTFGFGAYFLTATLR